MGEVFVRLMENTRVVIRGTGTRRGDTRRPRKTDHLHHASVDGVQGGCTGTCEETSLRREDLLLSSTVPVNVRLSFEVGEGGGRNVTPRRTRG